MISEKTARAIVSERSYGWCEIAIDNVCTGSLQSIHHRGKRSQGGSWAPSNLLAACGDGTRGCHGWVEANPAKANALGLWLFAGQQPQETPVYMRWNGTRSWWLLDDHGMLVWQHQTFDDVVPAAPESSLSFRRAAG